MTDFFRDEMISITPITTVSAMNEATGRYEQTDTDGTPFDALKWNRSAAARYYSSTYAEGITDVLVTDSDQGLTGESKVKINGLIWQCETPVNVAEQNEVYTIGIKRIAE